MDQVNINPAGPRRSGPPPSRPHWPVYLVIVVIVLCAAGLFAYRLAGRKAASAQPTATAQPAATATPLSGTPTPTAYAGAADTATPTAYAGAADTATPLGALTATPTPSGTAAASSQRPTNPRTLQVMSGTCTLHQITWRWSGALRATSYELVIYDPRSGATIHDLVTSGTSYTLRAAPGAAAALKLRSRNAAGTAPTYFTPGSVGHVPPQTTNPTAETVVKTDHTLTWFWTGAKHATAYDFVLYHYAAGTPHKDVSGRTTQGHWAIKVTPGTAYYLKVRAVGACAPAGYFTPATNATA